MKRAKNNCRPVKHLHERFLQPGGVGAGGKSHRDRDKSNLERQGERDGRFGKTKEQFSSPSKTKHGNGLASSAVQVIQRPAIPKERSECVCWCVCDAFVRPRERIILLLGPPEKKCRFKVEFIANFS